MEMTKIEPQFIIQEFEDFINNKSFPCVAARAAISRKQIRYFVADHMACPKDDRTILQFLYQFIDNYRNAEDIFHSAVIIFKTPEIYDEELFDNLLWNRLQSLTWLDAKNWEYDKRVSADPASPDFSFSLGEEAFFIVGLHPASSRPSRQFKYPALVFNPHSQFEHLRKNNGYDNMKSIVRQRDIVYSGSINPMLADFGQSSEVYQYSGRQYDSEWKCPLKINHAEIENHSSAK